MNRADLHALVQMPMPLRLLSPSELTEWIEIHQQLISQSKRRFSAGHKSNNDDNATQQLLDELNDRVFNLLGLKAAERWLVEDFVRIQLNLTHGKVTREVRRAPTALEINEYLSALCDCLNGFLTTNRRLKHKVEALTGGDSAFLSVSLVQSDEAIAPAMHTADEPTANNLQVIRNELRSKHSQWVYFDRGLKIYEPLRGTLYQFKPMQRLHWTRRQAVLDADEIIAETLVKGEK